MKNLSKAVAQNHRSSNFMYVAYNDGSPGISGHYSIEVHALLSYDCRMDIMHRFNGIGRIRWLAFDIKGEIRR